MKKLGYVLIALALAVLALPPVFGWLTEGQVRDRVESLRAGEYMNVSLDSYERGWFTSNAHLTITPASTAAAGSGAAGRDGGAAGDGDPQRGGVTRTPRPGAADALPPALALLLQQPLRVTVDVTHGPVSVMDGFFLGSSEFVARPAAAAGGDAAQNDPARAAAASGAGPYAFEFHGQTTFGGELHFAATLPPVDRQAEIGGLNFSGGRVTGTVAGQRLTAEGEAATLRYDNGLAIIALQGISASTDSELLTSYLVPGISELGLERASIELAFGGPPGGAPLFDAAGLSMTSSMAYDAGAHVVDSAFTFSLDSARTPETEISNARLEFTASDVDAALLEAVDAQAQAAAQRAAGGSGGVPGPFDSAALEHALAKRPSASINPLRFEVNGAPFDATAFVETSADSLPAGPVDFESPELWLNVLTVNATMSAEKGLVERVATEVMKQQLAIGGAAGQGPSTSPESLDRMAEAQAGFVLAMLAAQGMLEDTGAVYNAELRLENGVLTVNGNPVPLGLP